MEKLYRFWLCSQREITYAMKKKLLSCFGSAENIFKAKATYFEQINGMSPKVLRTIMETRNIHLVQRQFERLLERKIQFIYDQEEDFPDSLRHLQDCPKGLFYMGDLPKKRELTIAIVGARKASNYGLELSQYFAEKLAIAGISIISGMAFGIDAKAHQGTLTQNGKTYGVLGCGLDICYPKENINLYEEMKQKGGLISEYPLGMPPHHYHFPQRNRIIAGLSDAVLIIEAKQKSGSLITASLALEIGKDVWAVPGRITDELSSGCLELIRDGAKPILTVNDILEEYHLNLSNCKKNNIVLANCEKVVYSSICLDPKNIEEILNEVNLELKVVIESLYSLEQQGLIKEISKNKYIKNISIDEGGKYG